METPGGLQINYSPFDIYQSQVDILMLDSQASKLTLNHSLYLS